MVFAIVIHDLADTGNAPRKYLVHAGYEQGVENRLLIDDDCIVVACYMEVLKISLRTNRPVAIYEMFMAMFGIFHAPSRGYVVHSEMGVILLDEKSLREKWEINLGDIATMSTGEDRFRVCDDHIEVSDFCNYSYCLGYDGSILSTDNPKI